MHAAIETVFAKPRPPALDPLRATATHIQDTPLLAYHQGCTRPPDPDRDCLASISLAVCFSCSTLIIYHEFMPSYPYCVSELLATWFFISFTIILS
jgi:hypothetical protein